MSETLQAPSSLELRRQLQEMVEKELLGPAGGPEEVVEEPTVRGRYILGLLAPKGQSFLPDEHDDLPVAGTDGEDGRPASPMPQPASMLPSSIGLTFSVVEGATAIQITARWGRYERAASEYLSTEAGEPKQVWQRVPVEGTSDPIPLKKGMLGPWYPDKEQEVFVRGLIRKRNHHWTVTLYLVNGQQEPKTHKDSGWVFQPEMSVRSSDGSPIFVKRELPPELSLTNPEDRRMAMLYRHEVEFAMGHGVAVHAELGPGTWDCATALHTRILPTYEVERMEAPDPEPASELSNLVLDMKALSEVPFGGFHAALMPLVEAYDLWIKRNELRTEDGRILPDLLPYREDGNTALSECRQTLARIRAGIHLLDEDPKAAEAFQFANRSMALQRVRTIYTRTVRQGKEPNLEAIDIPKNRSWRPFQLAFILLNLPGLVDPTHPDRSHPTSAIADLLWFPTGGGKTEAYLGVAAFTMAIRRLQGELGGLSGMAGVTVLMRYTLRLLTLQQFQRAATLISACEVIRRENPGKWGTEPFRIGLWVGQRSTPNWTKDAYDIIKQDHNIFQGSPLGGKGTPHQITNCPWCGQPINPGRDIRVELYESGRGRTFQYCSDPLGRCPFSYRQSPDEGLPVVVVDEEIYRRLPTLVIATVDKFAQMPWKGETQMLFGRVNGYCPRHGYRSPEVEDTDSHTKKGNLPAVKSQEITSLRPPDLIIQDELHLISGPLGTLVGLYETAVDQLCTWELNGVKVLPKMIASTATIRRARDQVYGIFMREVKIFPPPGIDVENNFFAKRVRSSEDAPGRLYVGVCASGMRLRAVLIRVYAAYMSAAQTFYEKHGRAADPWMTMVGYFNSMRELGGMRRVVDDTLRTRLRQMDERGLANRYIWPFNVEELTSRKGGTDIPKILDRLESVFDPNILKDRKQRRQAGGSGEAEIYPLDVVLATNMISVGVDVGRLGLMVVASQPKATAEYIQATSRVGRSFPGIVCTVYNWARPRDLSHYERFEHYHATFYQHVEALSVTPFSPRALDRGLSAVLTANLRLTEEEFNPNESAGKVKRSHSAVNRVVDAISRRAGLVTAKNSTEDQVKHMIEVRMDHWMHLAQTIQAPAILAYSKRGGLTRPLLSYPTEGDRTLFTCLNSLRDVEPGVALVLKDYGMDREPNDPVDIEPGTEEEKE